MNYFERRNKIYELFGEDFYEKYPLSSRVSNRYIRSKIHYNNLETKNLRLEYQHNKRLRGLIKDLVYYLLYLLNLSLFRFGRNNQEKILVSPLIFNRFEILGKQLKDKYNICLPLVRRRVHLILKSKVRDLIEIDKIIYNKKLQGLLAEVAEFISKLIDNNNDFNKRILFQKLDVLENILNEEITKLSKIFKDKRIRLYISVFDQVYDDTFNILACQRAGIKTKCIAHAFFAGDIKDETKTNCLPVLADKLFLWSQEDYDSLKGYEEMEKIRIGGYPKFNKEYIKKMIKKYPQKKIITFFSTSMFDFDKKWMKEELRIRKKIFNKLKEINENKGYEIYIRYHGKYEKNIRKNEKGLLKKCHIKISRNPFIKDVLQSEINLGFGTSCIYEAKILGKKSFNLFTHTKYDKTFFMKNIEYIDVDDIERKLQEKTDNRPRYDLLMDIDSIIV